MKKIEYLNELFDLNPRYQQLTPFKQKLAKVDFLFSRLIKNTALIDYVQYDYFLLNNNGRKRFIDMKDRNWISNNLNNTDKTIIFDDKARFYERFSEFVNRDWVELKATSYQEFLEFIDPLDEVLIKPLDGSFGIGIKKIKTSEIENLKDFYNKHREKGVLLEEVIEQHEKMGEFNKTSLNTIRIVTVTRNKNVEIFGAVIKMGREGSIVDNHHSGGLSAIVDVETGMVITPATTQSFDSHVFHPESKKNIVGFEVPQWENLVSTVKHASQVIDEVGYVGWDVAITKNGTIEIIEGNHRADPDVLQRADRTGKWFELQELIEELEEK